MSTTNHYEPVTYISNGTTTKEIQSVGIRIDDDSTTGDRLGSTVLESTSKNVNLESAKNIQIKTKKGKVVLDTTSTIAAGNGNETLIISKVKENTHYNTAFYKTEAGSSTNAYCGDHGDILFEARRVRIKPFNVPTWPTTSTDATDATAATAAAASKTDGYIYLDTAGMESIDAGVAQANTAQYTQSADKEPKFEIRVGNHDSDLTEYLATGEYRPLVVKTRGMDMRCMTHGGIALQPCGYDLPNKSLSNTDDVSAGFVGHHENKIKLESSRIQDIYASDIKTDANGNLYIDDSKTGYIYNNKWVKGGDGLEFGTFNNLHSSLFTRDYRLNEDAPVYAVTRKVIYEDASGNEYELQSDGYHLITNGTAAATAATTQPTIVKADYETQTDDFKDIISSDSDKTSKVKDIIKTAYALNGGKDRHAKVTSSGNVEIQTNKTYHWVATTGTASDSNPVIPEGFTDLTAIYNSGDTYNNTFPTTGTVYKQNSLLYTWTEIESPEIQIVSDADVTIESSNEDVILNAGDVVKLQGTEIRFSPEDYADTDTNEETNIGFVNFGTTPKVVFQSTKITAKGKVESQTQTITSTIYNNTNGTIYYKASTNAITIPQLTLLYTAANTPYYPTASSSKTTVYTDAAATIKPTASIDLFVADANNNVYYVEINSSQEAKKNPTLLTGTTGYTNVTFCLPSAKTSASSGEEAIASKGNSSSGISCNVTDLLTATKYMKDNKILAFTETKTLSNASSIYVDMSNGLKFTDNTTTTSTIVASSATGATLTSDAITLKEGQAITITSSCPYFKLLKVDNSTITTGASVTVLKHSADTSITSARDIKYLATEDCVLLVLASKDTTSSPTVVSYYGDSYIITQVY